MHDDAYLLIKCVKYKGKVTTIFTKMNGAVPDNLI